VRETYDPNVKDYKALDIVTLNSTWFVAKKDNPGICPGENWKAGPTGRRGEKGERGERGAAGQRGEMGPAGKDFIDWEIDAKAYTITPVMSDGSRGPALPAFELFAQFNADTKALL